MTDPQYPIDGGTRPSIYYPDRMHGAMVDIARKRDIHPEHLYHAAAILTITLDGSLSDYHPDHDAVVEDLLEACAEHVDTDTQTDTSGSDS